VLAAVHERFSPEYAIEIFYYNEWKLNGNDDDSESMYTGENTTIA